MNSWREAYFEYKELDDPVEQDFFRRGLDFSKNGPFEDVYEVALLLTSTHHNAEYYFYRGQRDLDWTIKPSLFRDVDDIDLEIQKVSSLVRHIQSELQVSQQDALAIAKHYSGILENTTIRSWLLDVTNDPLVACFFASYNANPGDIGQIYVFNSSEMERYRSTTPKRLGEVTFISPDGVPRIERQRAAFIDGAHPTLLEAFLPRNWTFNQKEDVVFTDPDLSITKDDLLPVEDEYKEVIRNWEEEVWPEDVPPSKMVTPPHNPTEAVSAADYLAMMKEWLNDLGEQYEDLSAEDKRCIQDWCEVHAKITESDAIPKVLKNIIFLKQNLKLLSGMADKDGQKFSFDDVVMMYWHESGDPNTDRKEVKRIIQSVRPDHKFVRRWRNRSS